MENQRFFLYASLVVVLYLLWSSWQQYTAPTPLELNTQQPVASVDLSTEPAEGMQQDVPAAIDSSAIQPQTRSETRVSSVAKNEYITVTTDVFEIAINTRGGDIHRAELSAYMQELDTPDRPFVLLDDVNNTYITQSGLVHDPITNNDVSALAPNHYNQYQAEHKHYELDADQDELVVPLTWRNAQGIEVTKQFRFKRGEYLIDVDYVLTNNSGQDWQGRHTITKLVNILRTVLAW